MFNLKFNSVLVGENECVGKRHAPENWQDSLTNTHQTMHWETVTLAKLSSKVAQFSGTKEEEVASGGRASNIIATCCPYISLSYMKNGKYCTIPSEVSES